MSPLDLLTLGCGAIIGFSLGLTGGGGSIFAVPLLIYGLGSDVREAVGISLAAVGATSLVGALLRVRSREIEWRTGLIFAVAGVLAAPAGTRIGARLPDALTLTAFAILMVYVGWRMWTGKSALRNRDSQPCARRADESLHLTPRCLIVLTVAGLVTGLLSGIFGVGGGFIIVPALVMVSGMPLARAVTTSLLVIAMICASGVLAYYHAGDALPLRLTAWFIGGGLIGMALGLMTRTRLSGANLNRSFALAMWLVAGFVIARSLLFTANTDDEEAELVTRAAGRPASLADRGHDRLP